MAYRLVHLHLLTHGSPTPWATIDYAFGLAKAFEASLRVTSPRLKVKAPSHWLAGKLLAGLANELEQNAAAKAAELDARVQSAAAALGVSLRLLPVAETWPQGTADVAIHGRTSDLCILSLPRGDNERRLDVEAWLFGAGRPCLMIPADHEAPFSPRSVAVAWDGSRAAARAVGDALPFLKLAQSVTVLVARGEKEIAGDDPAATLLDLLAAHKVSAKVDEFDVERRSIGCALLDRAATQRADLLVMGGFGHSRLREFILGGATREILDIATLPILLSH